MVEEYWGSGDKERPGRVPGNDWEHDHVLRQLVTIRGVEVVRSDNARQEDAELSDEWEMALGCTERRRALQKKEDEFYVHQYTSSEDE